MVHEEVLTAEPAARKRMRKHVPWPYPATFDEQLREIIANTYGQIALVDHQVGGS